MLVIRQGMSAQTHSGWPRIGNGPTIKPPHICPPPDTHFMIASSAEARQSHHWSHDLLDFVAGAVGGAAGIAVGHPFDTVKVRLQNDSARLFNGPADAVRQALRREGVHGLFKGIETPLISSIPVNALIFGVYGFTLRRIGMHLQEGVDPSTGLPNSEQQPIWHHAAAGIVTAVVQAPIVGGAEYAKILMQNQFEHSANTCNNKVLYTSSIDGVKRVYREHGLRTTFRGKKT